MHSILLHATGKLFEGLTIEDAKDGIRERIPGARDSMGRLVEEGGVLFITPATKKKWFLRFSEFSFHIPARP